MHLTIYKDFALSRPTPAAYLVELGCEVTQLGLVELCESLQLLLLLQLQLRQLVLIVLLHALALALQLLELLVLQHQLLVVCRLYMRDGEIYSVQMLWLKKLRYLSYKIYKKQSLHW